MTTLQIFKFVNSQKTQKSKYLENEILLHRQIKKTYSLYIKDYNMEEDHNYRGYKIHILLLQTLSIILGVNGGCVCLHISRSRIYLCCNWISYRSELLLVNYVPEKSYILDFWLGSEYTSNWYLNYSAFYGFMMDKNKKTQKFVRFAMFNNKSVFDCW